MIIKTVGFLFIALISLNGSAENIIIKTSDNFALSANYVEAKSGANKGVLMLHQCNADKSMYDDLAQSLASQGISSLALDFRGYGESVTDTVSRKKIRQNAANRKEAFEKFKKIQKHWSGDVELAYQYLVDKVGSQSISFIGTSCGGGQAVTLAQKHQPKSFILFSTGMNENQINLFAKVSDVPALIVVAQGDKYTFKSSNKIFRAAKSKASRLISYKGKGHGGPLFKQDPNLKSVMVEWFKLHTK